MEIKKAEAEADAKVVKAEADKKDAIANARRDSVKQIQDAEVKQNESYEANISKEQAALDVKREAILSEGTSQAADLESKSDSRIQVVVEHLTQEFERTLNVAS